VVIDPVRRAWRAGAAKQSEERKLQPAPAPCPRVEHARHQERCQGRAGGRWSPCHGQALSAALCAARSAAWSAVVGRRWQSWAVVGSRTSPQSQMRARGQLAGPPDTQAHECLEGSNAPHASTATRRRRRLPHKVRTGPCRLTCFDFLTHHAGALGAHARHLVYHALLAPGRYHKPPPDRTQGVYQDKVRPPRHTRVISHALPPSLPVPAPDSPPAPWPGRDGSPRCGAASSCPSSPRRETATSS
jgi:hypothetical protein